MTTRRAALLATAGVACLAAGCAAPPRLTPLPREQQPPPAPREFRGAWVATVANIDWPRAPGLAQAEQREQARAIVQRAHALGLNALVLQVRPACDALYASRLEPASEYVSGTQGLAPDYDPLAWWIDQAHAHGLELHAWFNPFRARHPSARSPLSDLHVASREPTWAKTYGDLLWLDPGEPGAVAHTLAVIDDVVRRYDVDGVHLDDYFYPYPQGDAPFPDDDSYARAATALARDDWRRANVDGFVQALHQRVHAIKPWLKVGISPFALPRREQRVGRAAAIEGFDPHARLHADAERWLDEGWLDYAAPQLYWPLAQRAQAFDVLLEHWARANPRARHLWPGLFTSKWPADEIERQLAHLRAHGELAGGHIHFSMVALMQDRGGIASRLEAAQPRAALVPASPWLADDTPAPPLVAPGEGNTLRVCTQTGEQTLRWWALWQRRGKTWRFALADGRAGATIALDDREHGPLEAMAASTIARNGVESERVALRVMRHD